MRGNKNIKIDKIKICGLFDIHDERYVLKETSRKTYGLRFKTSSKNYDYLLWDYVLVKGKLGVDGNTIIVDSIESIKNNDNSEEEREVFSFVKETDQFVKSGFLW